MFITWKRSVSKSMFMTFFHFDENQWVECALRVWPTIELSGKFVPMLKENWNAENFKF